MEVFIVMLKLTIIMLLVTILLYSTYAYIRRHRKTTITEYKVQPYGCGEALSSEQVSVTSRSLYWSIISKVFKNLYTVLRNKIHTGILGDWFTLMVSFLAILVVALTLIALIFVLG